MAVQFELTKRYIEELKDLIQAGEEKKVLQLIGDLHAADIAEIYDEINIGEAKFLFLLLDGEMAADVLAELDEDDREKFLKVLPSDVIARQFIEKMDSDDAADVIADLSEKRKEEVLLHIDDVDQAGEIVELLAYDEDTAGGLMAKELIKVNENWTILTCLKEMSKQAAGVDEVYYVYVVDDNDILKGTVSLKRMLLSQNRSKIMDISNADVISVKTNTPSEEVANIMKKYDLVALPVIDSIGRLLGRITIDDVVDIIKEEAEKDYQMASGISEDVESTDNVWILTRARIPWLLIGLLGGVLVAKVIGLYEIDLGMYPEMAFFIPLIAAMGGNVGVQSSAIIVQGLANNTLGIESTFTKLMKELTVAGINGITLAGLIFLYNVLATDSFALTLTVSIALFSVIIFASFFGTFIPLLLNRIKVDPALATGPFITTLNDIMGLFIYLMIGRILYGVF
ncbi:Magnesium transporter MgtE [subsurface metagenome]